MQGIEVSRNETQKKIGPLALEKMKLGNPLRGGINRICALIWSHYWMSSYSRHNPPVTAKLVYIQSDLMDLW